MHAPNLRSQFASGETESALLERMLLESEVERLEDNYRTVIQLKYYHDLTITEIARTLEKPEGTIKSWLFRARAMLRKSLQPTAA